jgi:hypothetical protein
LKANGKKAGKLLHEIPNHFRNMEKFLAKSWDINDIKKSILGPNNPISWATFKGLTPLKRTSYAKLMDNMLTIYDGFSDGTKKYFSEILEKYSVEYSKDKYYRMEKERQKNTPRIETSGIKEYVLERLDRAKKNVKNVMFNDGAEKTQIQIADPKMKDDPFLQKIVEIANGENQKR